MSPRGIFNTNQRSTAAWGKPMFLRDLHLLLRTIVSLISSNHLYVSNHRSLSPAPRWCTSQAPEPVLSNNPRPGPRGRFESTALESQIYSLTPAALRQREMLLVTRGPQLDHERCLDLSSKSFKFSHAQMLSRTRSLSHKPRGESYGNQILCPSQEGSCHLTPCV